MSGKIIRADDEFIVIELKLRREGSMLDAEKSIQAALNEGGRLFTSETLKAFDSNGEPIKFAGALWYDKGKNSGLM